LKSDTWNFTAALVDAAGWGLGMGLISHTTFLPLFVGQLTASPYAIGAISAVMSLGWFMPGLLVAGAIERRATVKGWVIAVAAVERGTLLLLALLIAALGREHRGPLLAAFFACWLVTNAGVGCNTPAYYKLIAKTISPLRRGRLYGVGGALAGLLGIAGGELAGRLLGKYGYPDGFAACFLGAFLVLTLTVLPLAGMREPVGCGAAPRSPGSRFPLLEVAADRRLRGLILSHAFFCATLMAMAFYTEYAVERFRARAGDVAHFTSAQMAAQVVAYLLVGWIGDRRGNVLALQLASAAGVIAAALAWRAASIGALYPVFALAQLASVGWSLCWVNYVLELSPPDRTASYVALVSLALGPFRVGLPLLGSFLVRRYGYEAMFGAAGGLTALSLAALLAWVPEPRAKYLNAPTEETHDPGRGVEDRPAEV
jgi:MFS family permease